MSTYETLQIEQEGPIRWIAFNRPERRNAISWQLTDEFAEGLQDAEEDRETRVVIIKGNGPCWSAGHDLYEVAQDYLDGAFRERPFHRRRFPSPDVSLRTLPKPTIAAVHGYVGPQATVTAVAADLLIASEGTVFSMEQMRAGGAGCVPLILLTIGEKKNKEWFLLGKAFTAEELESMGLVNKVVPMDRLYDEARAWALEMAAIPPQNVAANKAAINMVMDVLGQTTLLQASHLYGVAGHGSGFDEQFFGIVKEKGLKAALEVRDAEHGGRGRR